MEYTRLLRIKYNNKVFDVFCDTNHRKTFLEVKIKDNIEKYYHPELIDLINLNLIYNTKKDELYKKKYTFKERIIISGFLMQLSVLTINSINFESFDNQIDKRLNIVFDSVLNTSTQTTIIHSSTELDEYGYDKVSFDEVRETLRNNLDIDDKNREYIIMFIDALEEKLPETDLRVFNNNLKTLTFKVCSDEEFNQEFEKTTMGCYKSSPNVIVLRDNYDSEYLNESVVFHELVHSMVYSSFTSDGQLLYRTYDIDGYGVSINDAMTEITAQYLLSEDWQNFFEFPTHDYTGYEYITDIYYPLLSLTDYTIYDFLTGNVLDFQSRLEQYDLGYVIDMLDVVMNGDTQTVINENKETINAMIESIAQATLNKNIGDNLVAFNLNNNNINYEINVITENINISDNGTTHEVVIEETIRKRDNHLIRIHDNENTYEIPLNCLRIYPILYNGNIFYRFAEAKEIIVKPKLNADNSNAYYVSKTIYQDLLTKEELSEDTQILLLSKFLETESRINLSAYGYTIDLNINILNNQKFVGVYNNTLNVDDFLEKEAQKIMTR